MPVSTGSEPVVTVSPEDVEVADDDVRTGPLAFDAIVIGAGQAGPGVAYQLAGAGQRVALVEADRVGGTCLNRGCRPTKALRASARVAHLARTASRHGVLTGEVTVDFATVMARKDALIDGWVHGQAESLGHTDGLTLLYGEARFIGRTGSAFEIGVGDRSLTAERVFLNVGTRATKPSIPGLDDVAWLDNDRVLHLDQLPTHLVILGGSYIGLEIGQLYARFGSAVTVIEAGRPNRRAARIPRSPLKSLDSSPAKASRSVLRRRSNGSSRRVSACACTPTAVERSTVHTCWSRSGELRTLTVSTSIASGCRPTSAATCTRTACFERLWRASGHSATSTLVERSRILRTRTTRSLRITSAAGTARRMDASRRMRCSRTRHSGEWA